MSTESSHSDAEAVITARNAHVSSWAVDGTGAMLGVWARGWGARPVEALAVRAAGGREATAATSAGVASNVVADLPSGWLANTDSDDDYQLVRVDHDASSLPLSVSGPKVRPRTGDVAVVFQNRVLLYRPADQALHVVPQPRMRWRTSAFVTPDGALLVAGRSDDVAVRARFDHGRWTRARWPAGKSVAVSAATGNHIVVALGGPPADGVDATPLAGVAITDDGGKSWREVGVPPHSDEALSVAVTADGTAFITTGTGPLLQVRPGGPVNVVRSLQPVAVSAVGNRLYALDVPGRRLARERLLVSRDHGHSWTPGALPGRDAP